MGRKNKQPPIRDSPYAEQDDKRPKNWNPDGSGPVVPPEPRDLFLARPAAEDSDSEYGTDDEEECLPLLLQRLNLNDNDSVDSLVGRLEQLGQSEHQNPSYSDKESSIGDSMPDDTENETETEQQPAPVKSAITIQPGNSVASDLIKNNELFIISFDLETGGEDCGICQISAVAVDLQGKTVESKFDSEFDSYVKPPVQAKWNQHAMNIIGYGPSDPRIQNANPINIVWPQFVSWCENLVTERNQKAVLVAWNGESSDMKWVWQVTSPSGQWKLKMPEGVDFFCDPCGAIKHFKSCQLNNAKTGVGHALGSVYQYVTGKQLIDQHNSLADAKAQVSVMFDKHFIETFFDRAKSLKPIDDVLKGRMKKEIAIENELTKKVPDGWKEEENGKETTWEPSHADRYSAAGGGTKYGPTAAIRSIAATSVEVTAILVHLFLFFIPVKGRYGLEHIATESNRYASEDWVQPQATTDQNGNQRKRLRLIPCKEADEGSRHQAGDDYTPITIGSLLVFFGILIAHSAYKFWFARLIWMEAEHGGIGIPWIQNAMPRNRFEHHRRFIHFENNSRLPAFGAQNWSPIQKIKGFMDFVMSNMQRAWTLGQKICIDESMVKYTGRAIKFIQFMLKKPIKHGIKIFALCCAYTGFCYGWQVYTGKSDAEPEDASVVALVIRLIRDVCFLGGVSGRILFTDNFYSSIKLACKLWTDFRMLFIGTFTLTTKGSRTKDDFPFDLLSKAAQKKIDKGWYRRAIQTRDRLCLQATIWMDRKIVALLHTAQVRATGDHTVSRWNKKERKRMPVPAPPVIGEYADCMGAVDMNDGDGANYPITFPSNCWYNCLFCWTIEQAVHAAYTIIIFLANHGSKGDKEKYSIYACKQDGCFKFTIHLAMALIDAGIRMDWKEPSDENDRLPWMRQHELIPCECKHCFFCKEGMTHGIAHKPKRQVDPHVVPQGHACDHQCMRFIGNKCKCCYGHLQKQFPDMSSKKVRAMRKTTNKGCPECDKLVCEVCWKTFVHVVDD